MSDPDPLTITADKDVLRQCEIDAQLAALRSPAPNTRAAAARRLGDLQSGIDVLLDVLHDPSEFVRAAAAMALGSFQNDPRAVEIGESLLAAIDDSSERVCQSAIRSLGMLQVESARREIETFLDDPNPYILGAAILSLARLGADDLAEELTANIHHESLYVQMQAVRAAAALGYTPIGPELVRLLEKTRAARQAAGFTDPSASRDRLGNDLYNLQNQLIRAAGELHVKEATPILIDTAQKDIGFRGLSIEALIAIGAEIDTQLLSRLLADPGVFLRKRLLALFAQYNYRAALPLIRPMLNDENFIVRVAALQALAKMSDIESLPRIVWISSHDPNPFLRVQALQTLVHLNGEMSLPTILALTEDANFQVRRMAVNYLVDWGISSDPALVSLARFAVEYPDDTLSTPILAMLNQFGFDFDQLESAPAKPPLPLFPEKLEGERHHLIDTIERWQKDLETPPDADRQMVQSALGLILDVLRKKA